MTREELKALLGVKDLYIVTREDLTSDTDVIFKRVANGCSPALIIADGKPDLLMFSWEDYKRRFAQIYPPGEFERLEKELERFKEDDADDLCDV